MPKLLILLFIAVGLRAAPSELQVNWDELAGAVSGKPVSVSLKDGSMVKGTAIRVDRYSLVVVASGSKNERAIPRDMITGLRVTKMRVRGRIACTIVGSIVGLAVGAALIVRGDDKGFIFPNPTPHPNRGEQVAGYGVLIGVPVGAYFLGRSLDRHEVAITISPTDSSSR